MTFTGRGGSNPPSDTQLAAGTQEAPRNRSASGGSRFPNISPSDMRRSSASRRSATVGSRRSTDGRSRPGATSQRRRGGNGCTSRPSTQPRAGTACAQWALDDGNPAHVRAVPPTSTAVFTTASPSVSRPAIAGSVRPPSSLTTPRQSHRGPERRARAGPTNPSRGGASTSVTTPNGLGCTRAPHGPRPAIDSSGSTQTAPPAEPRPPSPITSSTEPEAALT